LIGVLAAALVLAGCGSSSNSSQATQASQPVAAAPDNGSATAPAAAAPAAPAGASAVQSAAGAAPAAIGSAGGKQSKPNATDAKKSDPKASGTEKTQAGTAGTANAKPAAGAPSQAAGKAAPLTGSRTATDVGVFPDSIKVGHIGIYSGPVHGVGQDIGWAGQAVLRWYNDNGGINGRKLDVQVRDDAWDGIKGMAAAHDLVEREKVFGFCCIQTIPTNDLLGPYVDKLGIPNVGGDGWGEAQYGHQWAWPTGGSGTVDALVEAQYAVKSMGVKTASVFYYDSAAGRDFRDQFTKVFEGLGGKVVFSQAGTFDDPSTSTYVARSRTANVDMSIFWGEPGLWVKMVREAAIQAYKPPKGFWACACVYFDQTPGLAGPWAEGSIATVDWVPNEIAEHDPKQAPGWAEYKQILTRYYPQIRHSNWTRAGYVGARLFGDTLKKLGLNVTRQGLKDALDKVTSFDLGLGPTLNTWQPSHRAVHNVYLLKLVKDPNAPKEGGGMRFVYLAGPFKDTFHQPNTRN